MTQTRTIVPPRSRGRDKRKIILAAAETLFTTRRFHEITMDHVAAAAGVAKGTLYGHFKDKDDLFFQVCNTGFEELCELLSGLATPEAEFEPLLLEACRRISRFMEHRKELMQMMQAEENRLSCGKGGLLDQWTRKRRGLVESVKAILAVGVRQGRLRKDIPLEVLANVLMGMNRTRSRDLGDAPANMRSHEVIVELFCNGATSR